MREPGLNLAVGLAFIAASAACKPRTEQSDVKHVFGETRRDRPEPQVPCVQADYPTRTPVADAYLRKIGARIAEANPKTLSGAFALDRICFNLNDSDQFNAYGSGRFMLVAVNKGLLRYAASDAEVASVVAHELAHVVMRHDVALHPDVESQPDIRQLLGEAREHEAKVQESRDAETQLANEKREFYAAMRERLAKAFPVFEAAVRRMEELNEEALQLLNKEPYSWGAPTDPLPVSQMSSFDGEKLAPAARKRYDAMRVEYEQHSSAARSIVWKNKSEAERTQEAAFFDRGMKLTRATLDASGAASKARERIARRTEEILGRDVAANWAEAEADEVGYELYLRAGFVPEGYTWINRVIAQIEILSGKPEAEQNAGFADGLWSTERALEECLKARRNLNEGIVRGAEDHPTSCWRLSDIRIKEDKDHETEYAPLKAKATTEDLPGTPTLEEAQKESAQQGQ